MVDEADNPQIEYIDTSFVLEPMWDSAPDWSHYLEFLNDEEAIYFVARMYGWVDV